MELFKDRQHIKCSTHSVIEDFSTSLQKLSQQGKRKSTNIHE